MKIDAGRAVFVFDLDDTLYKEVDFLCSGYRAVAESTVPFDAETAFCQLCHWHSTGEKSFERLIKTYSLPHSIDDLLAIYRFHFPKIVAEKGAIELLDELKTRKIPRCLLSDGRSRTQRNKIAALGFAENCFQFITISEEIGAEKPSTLGFEAIAQNFSEHQFVYIGDNTKKDFLAPNSMGWSTIGLLDDGRNIHAQDLLIGEPYCPNIWVNDLSQIIELLHPHP